MKGLRRGTDVVPVDRIRRLVEREEAIFLQRVLGEQERRHYAGLSPGWPRWVCCAQHTAAKESVFKAVETGLRGKMKWTDVQVIYTDGVPRLPVSGETRRFFEISRIGDSWLSLGRTRELVIALVILIHEGGAAASFPVFPPGRRRVGRGRRRQHHDDHTDRGADGAPAWRGVHAGAGGGGGTGPPQDPVGPM